MLAKMTRYKVTVETVKRRPFPTRDDSEIFVNEQDCFFGYSYEMHHVGKYFDLWFTNPKENDPHNFVTFGRVFDIQRIPAIGGWRYVTKMGTFYVEEYDPAKRTIPSRAIRADISARIAESQRNPASARVYQERSKTRAQAFPKFLGSGPNGQGKPRPFKKGAR